jgi:Cu2+-exporting ATPase
MYNAGRKGILVKNGACLERLAQVTAIVFDKTGTITRGEPHVTQVISLSNSGNGEKVDEIIGLAAAVEQRHHHPASHAILRYAAHKQIAVGERSQSCQVRGMGVKAMIEDRLIVVGSRRLMESEGISTASAVTHEEQIAASGESIAYVAADGKLIGLIAYSDQIRPEATQAVFQLKKLGLKKIVMATGDGEIVAKHIADICGIKEYIAKAFPEQKVELVKQLKAQGHTVAVIGDGINDSPALAHADIAFSLHGCTEAAREGADIVLTDGDLRRLPESIRIARGAINLVKENLTLAVIPNGVGLGLAALGMVGPAGATLLNNGSAIVCGLNSLRPLYSDPWSKAEPIAGDK